MIVHKVRRLTPSSAVFFECDIQERFRELQSIYKYDSVIHNAVRLARISKALSIPLISTQQHPKVLKETVSEIVAEYHEGVRRFSKMQFSMLEDPVREHFESLQRRSVVLYGIEGHICVQQTALDLLERDYEVHLVVDAISSSRVLERSTALETLRRAGAALTTVEAVIFELLRTIDHENFKQMLPIIKDTAKDGITHL